MTYYGKYPSRDRAFDRAKLAPVLTSRGMGVADRRDASVREAVDAARLEAERIAKIEPVIAGLIDKGSKS